MPPFLLLALLVTTAGVVYYRNKQTPAKNVLGMNVPVFERDIAGFVGNKTYGFIIWKAQGPGTSGWNYNIGDMMTGQVMTNAEGNALTRKEALNKVLAIYSQAKTTVVNLDFATFDMDPMEFGGAPILRDRAFTLTITPAQNGYMTQVLDPRATVALLKTYPTFSNAMHEGYNFIASKGY